MDDRFSLGLDCNGTEFAVGAFLVLLDRLLAEVFVDFLDFATSWDVCNRAIVPLCSTRLRLAVKQIAMIKRNQWTGIPALLDIEVIFCLQQKSALTD